MTIRFRSEAASDVLLPREWYDAQRPGLGDEFVQALERVIDLIPDLPEAFPEIAGGVRRALLARFPYAIYYRQDSEIIDVIACLHTRRSPSRWRTRG